MKITQQSEAIVLWEMKYSESSKILKILTRELGKISVMAKGAMKANSRFVTYSQPYTHMLCKFSQGRNFYYMDPIEMISSNYGLRKDYNSIVLAGFIAELIDKSFLEGEISALIFDMLSKTFRLMSQNNNVENLVLAFCLKYISYLGYRPKLKIIDENEIYFSDIEGGITDTYGVKLSKQDVDFLSILLYRPLDEADLEYDKKRTIFLIYTLTDYIKYNLEIHEFNSLKIL